MFEVLVERLRELTAGRHGVVDLGCGSNEKFRQYCLCPYIGVDVEGGCAIKDDMRAIERWWPRVIDADTALFCDSLEHLKLTDALELLDRLKGRVSRVIVFVPLGDHKQDHGPDHPQTHRAIWTRDMLEALDFAVEEWPEFHTWDDPDKSRSAALAVWEAGR